MSTQSETWRNVAAVEADAKCASNLDCYGFNCRVGGNEGHSPKTSIVPSRTLNLTATSQKPLTEEALHQAFEIYGPLHSIDVSREPPAVRFFDLRDAQAAFQLRDVVGAEVTVRYASDGGARDLDEEGRIVVCVEGHLGSCELCHIFSTYGAVRNIQDVPDGTIHKVVEFFDVRSADKAIQALNGVDGDFMHAASVAYLERTRRKLFLIPPRLMEAAAACMESHLEKHKPPKTFPLGGAPRHVKPELKLAHDVSQGWGMPPNSTATLPEGPPVALTRFFDSSSSLFDKTDAFGWRPAAQPVAGSSCVFPESNKAHLFADQSSHDSSNGGMLKSVLPSALGLYPDEEPENTLWTQPNILSYGISAGDGLAGWNAGADVFGNVDDAPFAGFSPLTRSFMDTISGTDQQSQKAVILSCLLTEYREKIFRQAVNLEVMKRLDSLKSFDSPYLESEQAFRKYRSPEEWRALSKMHNKKKASRFPRRSSAEDMELEAERRAQQEKMFAMDLDRVRSGKDKRTTLMIKNIPNKYTQRMLLGRIEEEFKGTFDFFYLPIDFKNKCNVGYGFINMTSTDHIVPFVEHVHEQKWDKFNSDKVCCVTYARIQGRHALINHFQNSSLMLEDSKHQPLLFKPNGDPEPFPMKPMT